MAAMSSLPAAQRSSAMRALLRVWHPDKNQQNRELATIIFQWLSSALGQPLTGAIVWSTTSRDTFLAETKPTARVPSKSQRVWGRSGALGIGEGQTKTNQNKQ
jgi:hypothetical protein